MVGNSKAVISQHVYGEMDPVKVDLCPASFHDKKWLTARCAHITVASIHSYCSNNL